MAIPMSYENLEEAMFNVAETNPNLSFLATSRLEGRQVTLNMEAIGEADQEMDIDEDVYRDAPVADSYADILASDVGHLKEKKMRPIQLPQSTYFSLAQFGEYPHIFNVVLSAPPPVSMRGICIVVSSGPSSSFYDAPSLLMNHP